MNQIAIPAVYATSLAPITVIFTIETAEDEIADPSSVDFAQVTAARAIVTRTDGVALEWALTIAGTPTETSIILEHELDPADFFDAAFQPVAGGTYEVRILVTDPDGEHVLPMQYLAVERF